MTKREREMYLKAAEHFADDEGDHPKHVPACEWAVANFGDGFATGFDVAKVFESLAMDGL